MSQEMKMLIQIIALTVDAFHNCVEQKNHHWRDVWADVLSAAERELPRGSGFDSNPIVSTSRDISFVARRRPSQQIVIRGSYHGMDEHGTYEGWSDYTVHVWPEFNGVKVNVIGGGRHNEYIGDVFHEALTKMYLADSFRKDLQPTVDLEAGGSATEMRAAYGGGPSVPALPGGTDFERLAAFRSTAGAAIHKQWLKDHPEVLPRKSLPTEEGGE